MKRIDGNRDHGARWTRRRFMTVAATAVGGMTVGLPFVARGDGDEGATLGTYVTVARDGTIVIGARGCEIGQGVITSFAMLIAEELDVDWGAVRVVQVPYVYWLPNGKPASKYGAQGVGGSESIKESYRELRMAGALARQRLLQAAALRWSAPIASLSTLAGAVIHPDGRRLPYGELAWVAATLPAPRGDVPLRERDFRIVGRPTRVVDAQDIVTGKALYAIDQRIPGALVAVVAHAPVSGAKIRRVDASRTRAIDGVVDVVEIDGAGASGPILDNLAAGVAVLARDTWSALRGRDALIVDWDAGPNRDDDSPRLRGDALRALDGGERIVVQRQGDVDRAFAEATTRVVHDYSVPFLAHATLEPQNALVHVETDRVLLIAPLQQPSDASRMVSRLTGVPRERIEIRLVRAGGGFGRRLANDHVAEAVKIATAARRPIRLLWTREDDFANDWYRPFGVHRMEAAIDRDGRISAWRHAIAATPLVGRDNGFDPGTPIFHTVHQPDEFPAHLVPAWSHEFVALPFGRPRGWSRGPLPTFVAFAIQSFVDEVAHAVRQDPVAFRRALLRDAGTIPYSGHGGPGYDAARLLNVLNVAAERIDWGRRMPAGRGLGIAAHFVFGGYVAHAIEARVSAAHEVAIERCICVLDVGRVVNPLGVEAQAMGGTLDGIGAALHGEMTFRAGEALARNFDTYRLLRMAEAPDVEVVTIATDAPPVGAGEMGVPTATPALANAIFAATGVRIRDLPIARHLAQTPAGASREPGRAGAG